MQHVHISCTEAAVYPDMRSALSQDVRDRLAELEAKSLFNLRRDEQGIVDVVCYNAFHGPLRGFLQGMLQAREQNPQPAAFAISTSSM